MLVPMDLCQYLNCSLDVKKLIPIWLIMTETRHLFSRHKPVSDVINDDYNYILVIIALVLALKTIRTRKKSLVLALDL